MDEFNNIKPTEYLNRGYEFNYEEHHSSVATWNMYPSQDNCIIPTKQ